MPIGGIDQWITINGSDRNNPVLLFLHGGSGAGLSPYADALFAGWEKDFTLVQWDQRGMGRTFGKNGPAATPDVTVERMAQDGIDVASYLAGHLGKKKIILTGASWGSILGIYMIRARPDLFEAYVGSAQMVNWQESVAVSYARVLAMAQAAQDQPAITDLTRIGPPPWDKLRKWPVYRKWELAYQEKRRTAAKPPIAISPAYDSPQERAQWDAADDSYWLHFVGLDMSGELTKVDLATLGTDFSVPVFIVQGEEDLTTPPKLAKAWLDSIRAPRKKFYLVAGTGHEPSAASLALMRKILLEQVRPLAGQ